MPLSVCVFRVCCSFARTDCSQVGGMERVSVDGSQVVVAQPLSLKNKISSIHRDGPAKLQVSYFV